MATKLDRLLKKARNLASKGRGDKALGYYAEACERAGHEPDVWRERAELAAELGRKDEAVEVLFRVADMYARGGMAPEASEAARRVLELQPDHKGAKRFVRMLQPRLAREGNAGEAPANAEPEVDAKAQAEAEAKERAEADAKAQAEAEAKERAEADAKAQADAKKRAEAEAKERAEAEAKAQAAAAAQAEAEAKERAEAEAKAQAAAAAQAEAEAKERAEAEAKAQAAAAAQAQAEPEEHEEDSFGDVVELVAEPAREHERHQRASTASFLGNGHANGATHAEARIGRITGRLAIAELSLSEVVEGELEPVAEFPLDDGDDGAVVQAVAATVDSSPFLSELDSDLVRHLIDAGRMSLAPAGRMVFGEGESGASLYLVLRGSVDVERGGRRLATLRPGAFFGEMALLTDQPRSATIRAVSDATLLEVEREAVRRLIEDHPRVLTLLMRFFRARMVGTLVATSPLFAALSADDRRDLVTRFRLRELAPHQVVLEQGADADGLYLVLAGELTAFVPDHNGGQRLGQLGPGDVFGEMSLLRGTPAMASIRTESRAWVLRLPRGDFDAIVRAHPRVRDMLAVIAKERREQNVSVLGGGTTI